MGKKTTYSNKKDFEERLLETLYADPTKSHKELAEELDTYRQKVWREKKKLEEEKKIWGYTSVVNEGKMNYVMYIVLLKMKPMSEDLAELIIERQIKKEQEKQNVRLINVLYLNGEFDWLLMFNASDHASARKYYDNVRRAYDEYLLEKPVMVDVNFRLVREGKINPDIKELYDFVPK
ncbi:MAG: hypothetical protein ACOC55_03630 [Candidatus Natronoplasma sp.]